MDRKIKIRKYVSTRVLSGFYDTVVGLQMLELEVICYPALLGSYLAHGSRKKMQKYVSTRILSGFYKTVVDLEIVKVKVICYFALLDSYLVY